MGDSFSGLSYRNALEGADDAGWNAVSIDFVNPAPGHFGRFLGAGDIAPFRIQPKDQIVVQVKRLAFVRRDSMDVHPDQARRASVRDPYGCFFHCFASRCIRQCVVTRFDVPARQEPAAQAMMMDQQNALAIRMDHQCGACDVAGMELVAREGSWSMFEQGQNQLAAFFFLG
jgi:hypothetical protein